jgi:hypothetical protein
MTKNKQNVHNLFFLNWRNEGLLLSSGDGEFLEIFKVSDLSESEFLGIFVF